jgi:hypothetical protein
MGQRNTFDAERRIGAAEDWDNRAVLHAPIIQFWPSSAPALVARAVLRWPIAIGRRLER